MASASPKPDDFPPMLVKRLDTLYRSSRQIRSLTFLGLLVPIVLPIAASLGILYHFWRTKLLVAPEFGGVMQTIRSTDTREREYLAEDDDIKGKLAYLYIHKWAFLFPGIVITVLVVFLVACLLYYAIMISRA